MKARRLLRFGVLAVTLLWALTATGALGQTPPSRPQPNDVRVLVQGRYAYVADAHGYPYTIVRIVDTADPTHPVQVGAYTSGVGEYDDLALNGAYAYLSHGGYAQIDAVDVSNPANPVFVGTGPAYTGGAYLTVVGNTAYVTFARDSVVLHTVSLLDPAHPVEIASASTGVGPAGAGRPVVAAGYAYVPIAGGVVVAFDVHDPTHPARLAAYGTGGAASSVVPALAVGGPIPAAPGASHTYAYVAVPGSLHVVDVSDPANPTEVTSSVLPGGRWYAAQLVGSYLYGASDGGLQVLSLADPARPALAGTDTSTGVVLDVAVAGTDAYLAAGSEGLLIVGISNPSQPRQIGAFRLPEVRLPLVPQNSPLG